MPKRKRNKLDVPCHRLWTGATNIQAMQQFISQGAWSDDEVLAIHRGAVAKKLGRVDWHLYYWPTTSTVDGKTK